MKSQGIPLMCAEHTPSALLKIAEVSRRFLPGTGQFPVTRLTAPIGKFRYAERMKHRIRDFALFSIAGWLAASGTLIGQSRDELRRKYGEPLSETFTVGLDA